MVTASFGGTPGKPQIFPTTLFEHNSNALEKNDSLYRLDWENKLAKTKRSSWVLNFFGWMKNAEEIWEIPGNSPPHIFEKWACKNPGISHGNAFQAQAWCYENFKSKMIFYDWTTPQVLEVGNRRISFIVVNCCAVWEGVGKSGKSPAIHHNTFWKVSIQKSGEFPRKPLERPNGYLK